MQEAITIKKGLAVAAPSTLLIICLIGLPQISETIYSPALPAITESLETSTHLVQWTLCIYFIGFALGVGFWGKLSDHVGRRPAMLAGILLYICMSFACNNASTISYLLIARFFQAIGVSVGSVVTQAMMRDCFTGIQRNKIFSLVGSTIALAPALGPLLGGYLTQDFSWRANFICLTVMGILLLIYVGLSLPETRQEVLDAHVTAAPLPSLLATIRKMLLDKQVMAAAFLAGGFNGILYSYYSAGPYIFIDLFHLEPLRYGMLGVFMAAGACVGSLISHRINHLVDTIKLIKFSCYSLLVLMVTFSALVGLNTITPQANDSLFIIMAFMMLFYICFGIGIPNILSNALVDYQHQIGTASSIFGVIYYLWVALFLFGIGTFLTNSLLVMPAYFLTISILMTFSANFMRGNG